MDVSFIILLVINLLALLILIFKLGKKQKSIGKIVITDEDSLYVELNDYSSMDKIHNSKSVTFEVWHEKQISPK